MDDNKKRELYNQLITACIGSGGSTVELLGVVELVKLQLFNEALAASAAPDLPPAPAMPK